MASILIVEDDPGVGRMLDIVFDVEGHDTELVTTGAQAWQRLQNGAVDLVLLDVMLPDVDGLALLEEMRSDPRWDGVHVVVVSALDGDDEVWRGWARGTDYYMTKPFDLEQLRAVVGRLLYDGDVADLPTGRAASG